MPTEYFEIVVEGQDIIKQLYQDGEEDLLRPWYSALSNVYGINSNNYDGYMVDVIRNNTNQIKLICYVLENEIKTKHLKNTSLDWKTILVESAIKTHIEKLNVRFENIMIHNRTNAS